METLIECQQVSQDWKTFRWSRITLHSDPAANLIQMKVQTYSQTLQDEHGFAGQLEAIPKLVLHNATEVATFATQFKPGHCCFLEPASEKTWWNGYLNEPQGPWDMIALQKVDIFECHTSHLIIPPTEPVALGQLIEHIRKNFALPRHI